MSTCSLAGFRGGRKSEIPRVNRVPLPRPLVSRNCSLEQETRHLEDLLNVIEKREGITGSPVPVTLHVSMESRSKALRWYKVPFSLAGQPEKVYLHPLRNKLYFGARNGFSSHRSVLVRVPKCSIVEQDEGDGNPQSETTYFSFSNTATRICCLY
jgi:hypothetical protein